MVIDIGEVKRHIKPKADSTLLNMRKADLIDYIRCLEKNYNVAVSFNENQARYIESLNPEDCRPHGYWVHCKGKSNLWYCSECGEKISYNPTRRTYNIEKKPVNEIHKHCRCCGAKMDGKEQEK